MVHFIFYNYNILKIFKSRDSRLSVRAWMVGCREGYNSDAYYVTASGCTFPGNDWRGGGEDWVHAGVEGGGGMRYDLSWLNQPS